MPTQNQTHPLTPSKMSAALDVVIRASRPACIYGGVGIGKSETVAQVADRLFAAAYGYTVDSNGRLHDDQGQYTDDRPYLVDIRVALMDPIDLMGMPGVTDGVATFTRPRWFPTDERGGIVLLDEITRGSQMIQNALLQFTLNRRLGDHKLPARWRILAASNRAEDGGGVTKLNGALSERFIRLDMVADLDEWMTWAEAAEIHPLIIGYLKWKPEHFCTFDPAALVNTNPRSWFFASELLKEAPAADVELALMTGAVGYAVAGEVLAFVRTYRKCPSLDSILADPYNAIVPGPMEASALYATSAMICRAIVQDPAKADSFAPYLERIPTEYQAFVWKDSTERNESVAHTRAFTTFVVAHPEIF